jgi:hypothetical protein
LLTGAQVLLRKESKARNYLKRVPKTPPPVAEADDYERAWILLGDVYVQVRHRRRTSDARG